MADKRIAGEGSSLYFNGELIWHNPVGLGHFGIKLRKQIRENQIADRMMARWAERDVIAAILGAPTRDDAHGDEYPRGSGV
jgi:hypothetical protein